MLLVLFLVITSIVYGFAVIQKPFFVGLIPIVIFLIPGFFLVNPNGSRVLVLFGTYVGTVKENGIVQIQKLFTYDLVADPGFANAQLNRVNEKYGFPLNENLSVFEIDDNKGKTIIK